MRVVAVEASDTRMAHPAKQYGSPVEILVALLAVGIKSARIDWQSDTVMVIVFVTRLKI